MLRSCLPLHSSSIPRGTSGYRPRARVQKLAKMVGHKFLPPSILWPPRSKPHVTASVEGILMMQEQAPCSSVARIAVEIRQSRRKRHEGNRRHLFIPKFLSRACRAFMFASSLASASAPSCLHRSDLTRDWSCCLRDEPSQLQSTICAFPPCATSSLLLAANLDPPPLRCTLRSISIHTISYTVFWPKTLSAFELVGVLLSVCRAAG